METTTAGTLGRIPINAPPFLMPLLFQVGFGLTAVEPGQLVLIYFPGNLAMRSATTPMLCSFGFRGVLAVNGLISVASVGVFAILVSDLSKVLLWLVLVAAGATRSLQFTALNTLAFADIDDSQRATSTTLSAMTQQIAWLTGVALNVVAITSTKACLTRSDPACRHFHAAPLGMAVLGTVSALGFLRLALDTGSEVSGYNGK